MRMMLNTNAFYYLDSTKELRSSSVVKSICEYNQKVLLNQTIFLTQLN